MKKLKFKPLNLLYNFLIVVPLWTLLFGISPSMITLSFVIAIACGTVLSFFGRANHATMAIQKEIWDSHLISNYWRDNAFAKAAVQCPTEYVMKGKVVHIPKVNTKPKVVRNLETFPATPTLREDVDILYRIDEFFVKPWRIRQADKYELSYQKRESMMGDQSRAANTMAADWLLRHWFSYTQTNNDGTTLTEKATIMRTSGARATATIGTGYRKMLAVVDFKKAKVFFNKNDVPRDERFAVVESEMLDQLTQDPEYKRADKIYEKELVEGTVAKIQGFNIFERSKVLELNQAGTTLNTDGVTVKPTDNAGVLLYQKQGVETAMGGVDWFDNQGNPLYYGDIFSCLLRASGRIRRSDSVIALVQEKVI